jgi:hypothetical protein
MVNVLNTVIDSSTAMLLDATCIGVRSSESHRSERR